MDRAANVRAPQAGQIAQTLRWRHERGAQSPHIVGEHGELVAVDGIEEDAIDCVEIAELGGQDGERCDVDGELAMEVLAGGRIVGQFAG